MLKNYLKTAYAVFMRKKFFTLINLIGITFTLATLMVSVSVLDHIFGSNPPEVNQGRTLGIYRVYAKIGSEGGGANAMASYNFLDQYARDLPGVEIFSIVGTIGKIVTYVEGQRIEAFLKRSDANFWDIYEFEFVNGRQFTQDEFNNGDQVAVLNEATKEKYFGKDEAVGKSIEAGGKTFRVVGVVKDIPFLRMIPFADIWVPQSVEAAYNTPDEYIGMFNGVMLAKDRSYFPQIREEFLSRVEGIDLEGHRYEYIVAIPETVFDSVSRMIFSQARTSESAASTLLMVIVILSIFFMVLPTVNMMNLNTSRIRERSSEIGVRRAFGAPKGTLIGQFLVENVLITIVGGVLGLVLAEAILALVSTFGWVPYADFGLNYRIFFYAMLTTLFFGLFSGLLPAWRMSRLHPVEALRGGVA